jgi:hypothetical protein|tara:strand:+ start:384 stop:548 length:165 start_codon:yes stop_codon:yes gene_type:complete
MKAKTSITIKGQGSIALSQPKKVKVDTAHKPGYGKGVSRGKGAALRGNKFNGIF